MHIYISSATLNSVNKLMVKKFVPLFELIPSKFSDIHGAIAESCFTRKHVAFSISQSFQKMPALQQRKLPLRLVLRTHPIMGMSTQLPDSTKEMSSTGLLRQSNDKELSSAMFENVAVKNSILQRINQVQSTSSSTGNFYAYQC